MNSLTFWSMTAIEASVMALSNEGAMNSLCGSFGLWGDRCAVIGCKKIASCTRTPTRPLHSTVHEQLNDTRRPTEEPPCARTASRCALHMQSQAGMKFCFAGRFLRQGRTLVQQPTEVISIHDSRSAEVCCSFSLTNESKFSEEARCEAERTMMFTHTVFMGPAKPEKLQSSSFRPHLD